MKCNGCGKGPVLVESNGGTGSTRTCQGCGFTEVVNADGKRLLTDDRSATPRPGRLVEG